MPEYKLHYFDGRGLGEPIRLMFTYANVPFEDIRYQYPNVPKEISPFKKLPVLEVDDKILPDSFAIYRYLAKQYKLSGKDDFESAEIDAIGYMIQEFKNEYLPVLNVIGGIKKGNKDELRKRHLHPALSKYVPFMEQTLTKSGNGYYHHSGLSWVDFYAATTFFSARKMLPEDFSELHLLAEHCDRIHSLPQLQNYLVKRVNTLI